MVMVRVHERSLNHDLRKLRPRPWLGLEFSQLSLSLFMSTAHDHDQAQSNELDKGDNILVRDQPPNGTSAMAVATNTPSTIPQHVEDHPTNGVGTPGANDTPPPHLISQSVPLDAKAEPELGDEDATGTTGGDDDVESEVTDGEEDEEDEDGDEEDDDEEPALKYERFGGAFQDLLKKDSASVLAVSTRFLVRDACKSRSDRR